MTVSDTRRTDDLNDKAWMAARIRKSEDWINHNLRKIPHIKIGANVWFTEEHAVAFLKAHEVLPSTGRTERSRRAKGGAR